jgi:hypothetical protein
MNESTKSAQKSRFARSSHFFGVLSLLLLMLSGLCIMGLVGRAGRPDLHVLSQGDVTGLSLGYVASQFLAAVAAVAALILGILGLGDIRRGAGKVKGTGLAVSGLVTATLTVLPLVLVYVVIPLVLAAGRPKVESSHNLKRLGLAMLEYHDVYRCFPPAVLHDPALGDRAQPYSWRVALLPFLEEGNLYSQYRRDEPWDSPANTAVLDHMPRVFARPGSGRAENSLTHYQVLVGPGTAFERPDLRITLQDFPRGAAETILVVEAADPVPWTKPVDLPFDPNGPMPKVGGVVGNGFYAVFADVTVRWIDAEQQE